MNKVIRKGAVLNATSISTDMISHPVWHRHPKLFQLWVYIQSSSEVTYGSMAKAMGVTKRVVEKHVKKLKEIGKEYGIVLLEVEQKFFCPETNTKRVNYIVSNNYYDPFSVEEMNKLDAADLEYDDDVVTEHYQRLEADRKTPRFKKDLKKSDDILNKALDEAGL